MKTKLHFPICNQDVGISILQEYFTKNKEVKSDHITTDQRARGIGENLGTFEGRIVTHTREFQESLSIYLKNELHKQQGGHNG